MPDHYGDKRGGLPPKSAYGRPAQAPGVGARAKRHDLERRDTPYLQGSDLQYGEVQEMQAAQKQMNARQQQSPRGERRQMQRPQFIEGTNAPDPVQFMAGREKPMFPHALSSGPAMESWAPIVRAVANNPNSSPVLRRLFIRTLRNMQLNPNQEAYRINLGEIDSAILGE